MFLFAGHDPGSLNHIRPLYQLAQSQGREVWWEELRAKDGTPWSGVPQAQRVLDAVAPDSKHVTALVCGISTNKAELALVEVCNKRNIPTVLVIDFAPGHRLQVEDRAASYPRLFLVTNDHARSDVMNCGVAPEAVALGGSTYLETLAVDTSPALHSPQLLREAYGLPPSTPLMPFFLAPDDMVPEALSAIPATVRELHAILPPEFTIVIRPHPRNSKETLTALREIQSTVGAAQTALSRMVMDQNCKIDNKSLARGCTYTLSMGSTVSVECMAWGTPSGFFQIGWDPVKIEAIMHSLPAPRIRSSSQLDAFLAGPSSTGWSENFGDCGKLSGEGSFDVENCMGAAERCWAKILELV